MEMRSFGTILGVWAHPDDETYLMAGIMAQAVRDGSRVVCVTATRGEAGSQDHDRWPPERMGEIREAELLACLNVLGVTEHIFLDYIDGTCHTVDAAAATERIAAIIADVGPDTVMTFGPDGMTDHLDHKAISAWTTAAFERVARPGAQLCYATTTQSWADRFVERFNEFNVFGPGTPPVTPPEQLAIDFELPEELLDLKMRAVQEHKSQVEGLFGGLGRDLIRSSQTNEMFRLAATA
jgi:LmbE family N-acetylglucosaminyl deacetylase